MPGKDECLGSQVPDASPSHAPGAGKALQLLSSRDPGLEGKGRSTCLGRLLLLMFPSISILGVWLQPKDIKTHRPSIYKWPQPFPQPLLVPRLLRHEVSVRAHPHLGTSGHSTKSFPPAGPSPAAPPCATAAQSKREMPAPGTLRKDRINVIYVPGKEQTSTTAKIKQKVGKKPEKERAQGLHQHTKLHEGSETILSSHPPKDGDFCNTAKINTTGNCIIRGALSSHI